MLRFAGDSTLVVVDREVRVVELVRGEAQLVDVAAERVIDIVGFPDQLWIAARDSAGGAVLHRFGLDGASLGAPVALPSPAGRWVPATLASCAIWSGRPAALVTAAGVVELEAADLIIPQAPARLAVVRGNHVALRSAGSTRWDTVGFDAQLRAHDGAFLYDGSSLLVVAARGATQTLAVLTARDGVVQQRLSIAAAEAVAIAARRGHAIVRVGARRLLLVDLRFARTIGDYEHADPIEDLAINAAATTLALVTRDADGARALLHLAPRELFAVSPRATDSAPVIAVPPDPPEEREAPAPDAPAPAPAVEPFALIDAPALVPRSRAPRTDSARARGLLEHERAVIAARCYLATAQAWDQGRLVWDSESERPYETELMGLLDRQRGRAADRIGEAMRAVADAEAALAAARAEVTTLSPVDELADELGLSPLARRMLLVIAAPAIWGEIARLYGILANDAARGVVDEMMLRQVLGATADLHDIARELDPDRPLIQRGVIHPGAGAMRPFFALQVAPLAIKRLRGDALGPGADPELRLVAATRPIDRMLLPPGLREQLRDALGRVGAAPLRLVVRGRKGAGRLTLISALAETANRTIAVVDAAPLVRDGRVRGDELAARVQRAALGGWLPCVDNLDAIGHDDRGARDQLREVLRTHPGPLALRLGADVAPPLDPGYVAVDLPALAETRRIEAWQLALTERGLALPDVEELASRWVLGPGTVHRVLDQLRARGDVEPGQALGRLDGVIRQHLESRLGDIATRMPRLASWAQIVLPPDILDSLLELVARVRHRRTVFERWGYDRVMTSSRGLTALFQGGPGTGKTMVASAIARELGLDVYRVDLARIVSKWIGETERNLAQLFDAAEDGQAMILFDEADALFAKRTEVKTSVDRYANLEVNYLLQRLDSFGGIAILTTNFGGAIDTAFKRRLSFRLSFPFPDDEMREQLWRVHLPAEVPRRGELDLADLARKYRMSGGYIRNAALRAAFLAAAEESELQHDHLERAVRLEYREIGKLAETGALE